MEVKIHNNNILVLLPNEEVDQKQWAFRAMPAQYKNATGWDCDWVQKAKVSSFPSTSTPNHTIISIPLKGDGFYRFGIGEQKQWVKVVGSTLTLIQEFQIEGIFKETRLEKIVIEGGSGFCTTIVGTTEELNEKIKALFELHRQSLITEGLLKK